MKTDFSFSSGFIYVNRWLNKMLRAFSIYALSLVLIPALSLAQDWQPLFDGKSLTGWKAGGNVGSFQVINGQIACDGPPAHLFYVGGDGRADFTNFELSAEVMTHGGANSGIYFHTAFQPTGFPEQGFEVQVLNVRPTAGNYSENRLTGSLYGLRNVYKPLANDDEWVTLCIRVVGKSVQVRVNDQLVVDYLEANPAPDAPGHPGRKLRHGTFALQCHGGVGKVFYRNLRVRRLPDVAADSAPPPIALNDYDREVIRLSSANYPVVNYHVHLKGGLTLDEALAASRRSGVFYGIAVNCGLNFSVTNDAGINDYLKTMQGQPCFVAMQAEGREWVNLFSKAAISRFDYVFTDAMTIFDDQGQRMRLWIPNEVPEIKDPQAFMDMLVERTVKILRTEPINVYVNPTFLPEKIAADYDRLWTEERMQKVATAAAQHHIAVEINSRYKLPHLAFIKLAKAAGCKFTFGTNNGDRDIGQLDYSFDMIRAASLQWQDIWTPKSKS